MIPRVHRTILALIFVLFGSWIADLDAHQDPCHRPRSTPRTGRHMRGTVSHMSGEGCSGEGTCPEHRRECVRGMRTYMALVIAALLIGSVLSSCATRGQLTPTAPACAFVERCRNPALTTSGG